MTIELSKNHSDMNNIGFFPVTIRQGLPTSSDSVHYSQLAIIAADGLFKLLFGSKQAQLLQFLYLQENTNNSYQRTYFITQSNVVLGEITAYTYRDYQKYNSTTEKLIIHFLSWRVIRLLLVLFLLRLFKITLSGVAEDEMYIESIAIYEPYQGRQLGKQLLMHIEQVARNQRCTALSLDVDAQNKRAIKFYQRFGFVITKRTQASRIHKMVKKLEK